MNEVDPVRSPLFVLVQVAPKKERLLSDIDQCWFGEEKRNENGDT